MFGLPQLYTVKVVGRLPVGPRAEKWLWIPDRTSSREQHFFSLADKPHTCFKTDRTIIDAFGSSNPYHVPIRTYEIAINGKLISAKSICKYGDQLRHDIRIVT